MTTSPSGSGEGPDEPAVAALPAPPLLDAVSYGVVVCDAAGRIVLVNAHAEGMLGYTRNALLGEPVERLIPPIYRATHARERARYASKPPEWDVGRRRDQWALRADGSELAVEIALTPITLDGRLFIVAALYQVADPATRCGTRPCARRGHAEPQLEEQFRHAQRMEALGRLTAGIAHDFNNILTVIDACSVFLLEGAGSGDPRRADVEEIQAAVRQASSLTRQLLTFSRPVAGGYQRIALDAVVTAMRTMLRRVIHEHIEIVTALASAPWLVEADSAQIEQVLMNLAVNARDAMPEGGRLTIETTSLSLVAPLPTAHGVVPAGSYAVLRVRDTGVGVDPATLPRIFEPFFTLKAPGAGTGLGLATVHRIVSELGGHIAVESEPGRGTAFAIYLPRANGESATPSADAPPAMGVGTETVLLVEDDGAVRALVRRVLATAGYRVLEAADGVEALRICREHPGTIDLLLTDVVLPLMNGRELAARVAELHPHVKSMFMSGYGVDDTLRRILDDSAPEILPKPFSPADLVAQLRRVLDTPSAR